MGNNQQKETEKTLPKDTILFAYMNRLLTLNAHLPFYNLDKGHPAHMKYRYRIKTTRDLKFHLFTLKDNKLLHGDSTVELIPIKNSSSNKGRKYHLPFDEKKLVLEMEKNEKFNGYCIINETTSTSQNNKITSVSQNNKITSVSQNNENYIEFYIFNSSFSYITVYDSQIMSNTCDLSLLT